MSKRPKIILLADDDADDRELLEEVILTIENDAVIHEASSGTEALAHLKNCSDNNLPCLIILDYNMPDLNGAEVIEIINEDGRYKNIPLVIWSTSNLPFYKKRCEKLGARAYFHKPHSFGDTKVLAINMLSYCDVSSNKTSTSL